VPCSNPEVTCPINGQGLFQLSVIHTGTDSPTQPWGQLSANWCQITLTGMAPMACTVAVWSKASVGFPPFPDHWWVGGVNGNTTPIGQTFGGGSDEDATDPTDWVAEPVNTLTGSYYTSMVDAYLPGFGTPFKLKAQLQLRGLRGDVPAGGGGRLDGGGRPANPVMGR
jgi:hypothetical protein